MNAGYFGGGDVSQAQLQQAIQQSIMEDKRNTNYEPIARVDQRIREKNQPTGLRNIGNTCYFNSLLQVYYTLPSFVTKILKFQVEQVPEEEEAKNAQSQAAGGQPQDDAGAAGRKLRKKLVNAGMKLVKELQMIFTTMALGNKKYLDPSGVLEAVVDNHGDRVAIGEEKDISEYN